MLKRALFSKGLTAATVNCTLGRLTAPSMALLRNTTAAASNVTAHRAPPQQRLMSSEKSEDDDNEEPQRDSKNAFLLAMLPAMRGKLAPRITKDTILSAQERIREYQATTGKEGGPPMRRLMLIDVRSFDKTRWGQTVPGAYNIPLEEVANGTFTELYEKRFDTSPDAQRTVKNMLDMFGVKSVLDLPGPDDNLVFFGETPDDGEFGCIIFRKLGFKNVFNYRGGIPDWFGADFVPLRRRRRRTEEEEE